MTRADDLEEVLVLDDELWQDGPPHELFDQLRKQCPVHWSSKMTGYPYEAGYWSITRPEDIQAVSRDWETFSSEKGGFTALSGGFTTPMRSMFIAMDPPRHDRIKALFQSAFTPKRIAAHEGPIREIVTGAFEKLAGRDTCDLAVDVARPVAARVIGRFMGIPEEEDAVWARLTETTFGTGEARLDPAGIKRILEQEIPEVFERCKQMILERRANPTDDLTSVLVQAEVDGEKLEEFEMILGFFLLVAAGNDSTKATYCSGMRAILEDPEQQRLLIDDPSLIPGAVEESLRMFPAFPHQRRTATRDTTLRERQIKEGEKVVMWYVSSNRDEDRYEEPHRFDVRRNPEHQAFGGGGRHFCLGSALARLQLRVLFEETLARYPEMTLAGTPEVVVSGFVTQLKTLPVRLIP